MGARCERTAIPYGASEVTMTCVDSGELVPGHFNESRKRRISDLIPVRERKALRMEGCVGFGPGSRFFASADNEINTPHSARATAEICRAQTVRISAFMPSRPVEYLRLATHMRTSWAYINGAKPFHPSDFHAALERQILAHIRRCLWAHTQSCGSLRAACLKLIVHYQVTFFLLLAHFQPYSNILRFHFMLERCA